jgi:hypothetical protein
MNLTKADATKDFAFLTLICEQARDVVFKLGLVFQHKKIHISITRNIESTAPLELCINTTLVANNLPPKGDPNIHSHGPQEQVWR